MTDVYLNGTFMPADQAQISPMDRGFLFADGVYEVIPAFNGVMFGADEHLQRLQRSLDEIQIANPHRSSSWRSLCSELIVRNGGGDLSVYLQVTRGAPLNRDHAFPAPPVAATVFMTTASLPRSAISCPETVAGEAAIVVDDIRWARCDIKSVSLLPNTLMRQRALKAGAIEAIQVRDGLLTEGSSTNVFVVTDGRVATPPRSHRILAGITREVVLRLCREIGLSVEEREISRQQLLEADEVWLTSSTKDALPIVRLDGRTIGDGRPGHVWKDLASALSKFKRTVCSMD